ncbi:MAG: hypothetical protein OEM26_12870 [Saprospiraceae bacterium]|nr:hypothetical protein [Saprospiraceae bacterium]
MKIAVIPTISLSLLIAFSACEHSAFEDEVTLKDLTEASAFVRFDNTLKTVIDVSETDAPQALTLEYIFPGNKDITVNYNFSGSAAFGTDFTIEGASPTGGTITLIYDALSTEITTTDLVVTLLQDGITDGNKSVTFTLTSASASDGSPVDAGQAGMFREITINIADADCASDLDGMYNYVASGAFEGAGAVEITKLDGAANYAISDFAAGAFGDPVPYEFSVACGGISAPAASVISEGILATITGTADEDTKEIIINVTLNCCGGEGAIWTLMLTPV